MATRVAKALVEYGTPLEISSVSEKLQQVDFISFTSTSDASPVTVDIFSTTSDATNFPNAEILLHSFKVPNQSTVIFNKDNFPLGNANSYSFGNHASDNRLFVRNNTTRRLIVHYSVTDAGVSTDYTTEQLQDIVGAMVDGGTETNIAVTYDDTAGKLNFVSVDTDTNTQLTLIDSDTMTGASATNVASAESVKAYVDSSIIANTDTQDLSISGQTLSLTNGGSVTLPDTNTQLPLIDSDTMSGASATNVASAESIKAYVDGAVIANTDTQDLSISGQTLSLTNGGSVTLPDTNTQLDNAGVIGKVLTGIDVSTTADVVAADTIVAAIGKLENRVATNDDKVSFPGLGISSSTALAGDTTTITTGQASAISANTLKNTNVVGDLSFTAVATKLQINTTNGAAISIPAATNTAWGAMSDDLVIALEANTAKPSFPAAVATGNILWKQAKVTLSEAQLTNMHSQAIQLIPAAGANTIIMVGDALALVDRDSSTAQGVASDLCIGYNGTTNYYESILYERRFMYNESGDRTWSLKADYSGEVGASLTAAVNVDVTAAFNVAITSGSLDSITLYIQYYIIDNS